MGHTRTMISSEPDGTGIRTEVRTSLGDLAHRWDELVDMQALPSPFLRSWWIDNAAAGAPRIVCVFRDDELIGGAAFETHRWGPEILGMEKLIITGGGLLAPDHIDLVAVPDRRAIVARRVLEWMLRPGARLIELDGLSADGTLAALFSPDLTATFEAPLAELPEDHAQYVASRPGKVRSTIKRRTRQLTALGAVVSTAGADDLDRAMRAFFELHDLRWSEESGFLEASERFREVMRAAVERGEARINELRLESGETIAVEIDFRVGDRLFFYQSGRRTEHEWRGCGTVLRAGIIEAAIGEGIREYDMLRGSEPYKTEWATTRRMLSSHSHAVGIRVRLALTLRSALGRLRRG